MSTTALPGWDRLRHGGLLLDPPRLQQIARLQPDALPHWYPHELRRQATSLLAGDSEPAAFITFVLERICGFTQTTGTWLRGSAIGAEWSRRTATGETVRPRQLWRGPHGSLLPVFLDSEKQVGIGRGRRTASLVVQWLRAGGERLALLTNGRQWRLIFAGLDFDAWCEWDTELWFEEGQLSSQVNALRTLLSPRAWTSPADAQNAPLLTAVLDSRKGQAELSAALGERVREAVELLVQAHGEVLQEQCAHISSAEIYRAAVRVVMRLVVILFAESRDLLPRDNALYHAAYGIGGLLEELERIAARGGQRLARQYSAWPRLLALFRLVHQGSHHPALPVPAYGGELFAPAGTDSELEQALQVFESAAFDNSRAIVSDREILRVLEKISRTRVRLRQGRQNTTVTVPVDFSDLSSEYIGILYEGLLDFELKTAPTGDPVIFLAVGNQPALPLSRLEAMDDRALAALLEKMQDTSSKDAGSEEESDDTEAEPGELDSSDAPENSAEEATDAENTAPDIAESAADDGTADHRHQTRTRAEVWARRAAVAGGLVKRAAGNLTPAKQREYEELLARKARQLVIRVVLPGEWFLVRWGGTRKGSGTFYTRPGLAVPTVQRTLRPLAYAPPTLADGSPDTAAPACDWLPRAPEEILALKTCDPACGSGTFPVASLRFLTDALFASVHHHGRVADRTDRAIVSLLGPQTAEHSEIPALGQEMVPCRPQDPAFEPRLKSVLKRYLVERCIYGVDLDPLAVELCRLSLWIETMDRTLPFSFLDHKVKCGNGLVGAWFDQFLHYPVMAWKNREGGDKGHTNGVHYQKEARGKALREFATGILQEDLRECLAGPSLLDRRDHMRNATQVHTEALGLLARLHDLPVQDAAERARLYRSLLLAAPAWRQLKSAMDLWCACWFWPAESLDVAPLPSTLAQPSAQTQAEADRIAAKLRFFHWELEFPDVFRAAGSGFDAILGNPPWDIAKPNSKEFFSNLDPLYRTYGKQEALRAQTGYFADAETERRWLDYNADFRAQSNFMKYAASPFGDPATSEASSDRFSVARGRQNDTLHAHWREIRRRSTGFADPAHPFRHQGSADINLYKTFLEQAHALLRSGGRLGFIIPSGLYSDHGTGSLRRLFLDRCQWEWLFGIENREGIFEIHRSFKFNPIIIQKGGTTTAIRTAFMRRKLEDWERAEEFATAYTRTQIDRFSPRSQAILEIQSAQDLQILERIYSNSVLLGDDGPDGWGIKYSREFDMTNDSKLFPPRTKWEEQGYRPDEYSRWLKGDWRPIAELWTVLGIDPSQVVPPAVELEDWLFDSTADPTRRAAEAQFVHGHLLKPGDVARTPFRLRCAQPPYDTLPIPRADIPEGIVLNRNAELWIKEDGIQSLSVPLYQGIMIHQNNPFAARHVAGLGANAIWDRTINPQPSIVPAFLLDVVAARSSSKWTPCPRLGYRRIARTTDVRTVIAAPITQFPAGDSLFFYRPTPSQPTDAILLSGILNSFWYDFGIRIRLGGTNLSDFIMSESAIPKRPMAFGIKAQVAKMALRNVPDAPVRIGMKTDLLQDHTVAILPAECVKTRITIDAVLAVIFNLRLEDIEIVLDSCDFPSQHYFPGAKLGRATGFWRVDKDKSPELRHTVLTLIAFHDLESKIREHGGDRDAGIAAFLAQNNGEGWLLPETLRLADYGLGHDDRAQQHQPVASRLGPRFYDWQLAQTAEESWRECHLHARNLLGEEDYQELLADIAAERDGITPHTPAASPPPPAPAPPPGPQQGSLF